MHSLRCLVCLAGQPMATGLADDEAKRILTKIIDEEKSHMAALQGLLK